ncbi:hypothetical protein R3P38DRAFT_2880743 [Favolaschia claudopus]|uniref:Uncharacterized protein n=1 Tax=Favolaschia claudopus TaxID=2862362 RepID=A0AAW0CXM6_9AGAR
MDSQWCLDECPTCSTVVNGPSIYCSPECEPPLDLEELDLDDPFWSQQKSIRVSTWALECYQSTEAHRSTPSIFISPSQRKLHVRKTHPTSWVNSETSPPSPPSISSSISTSTAVESLVTSSTSPHSPISRWSVRSWPVRPSACSSPGLTTPPIVTKTSVYLVSDSLTQPETKKTIRTGLPPSEKASHTRLRHLVQTQHDGECSPRLRTPTHALLPPPRT